MRLTILVTLCILSAACHNTQTEKYFGTEYEINTKAIKLNEKAVRIMSEYPDSLNYAIKLLGESIKADSNYYVAYENKINWESDLKEHSYGIPTLKAFIKRFPEQPASYLALGFRQERSGNDNAAKSNYKKSLELLNGKIENQEINADSIGPELFVLNYVNGDTVLALHQFEKYKQSLDRRGLYRNQELKDVINNLKETY